jgi:membrane protease YdiL (CAAX protease family)
MTATRPHWAHFLNVFNPVFIGRQWALAWGFVHAPSTQPAAAVGLYRGIVAVLALLIGLKLVQVLVIVVRVYSQDYGLMPMLTNAVERETLHWPWWQMLLAAGLIGPLLEELAFRAHLRFGRVLAALSITAATYYILTQAVYGLRSMIWKPPC